MKSFADFGLIVEAKKGRSGPKYNYEVEGNLRGIFDA